MDKNIKLNNGEEIPPIGFGTFVANELENTIPICIDLGYRLIDTAFIYQNEAIIGKALSAKFEEGKVKREDLFIVSKLWNTAHKPEEVLPAIKRSLSDLQLKYLDLYLIHWPLSAKKPENPYDLINLEDEDEHIPIEDTWKAMEELVKLGLTKSIGVSNFNSDQIERILNIAAIKPVVNQIECHVYLNQKKFIEFCKQRDIVIMSYSPFYGSPGHGRTPIDTNIFEEPVVKELTEKYKKSSAQIILKFLIQLGTVPIPKSDNPERIKQNIDVFDFSLNSEDIEKLESLNKNIRGVAIQRWSHHNEFPFHLEY